MEYFFILVLIVVVIILLTRSSSGGGSGTVVNMIHDLSAEIRKLQIEIVELRKNLRENADEVETKLDAIQRNQQYTQQPPAQSQWEKPTHREQPYVAPVAAPPTPVAAPAPAPEPPIEEVEPETPIQLVEEPVLNLFEHKWNEPEEQATTSTPEPEGEPEMIPEPLPVAAFTEPVAPKKPAPVYEPQESGIDKWLRNNPDLEKFIGENLINKIGIAILVLGIAFFVKYAIDQNWINEVGRVCIGLGCGAILIGVAHFLRNNYRSFSSVLAGGGIAVFYFTIAFAFHQYHLMSQTAAFVMMVVITAFAIALSVLYDKLELAFIATIGGFITPFLVATGEGNYIVLFTYLIILNVGIVALSFFKRWPGIRIVGLFFTIIIYGGWLARALEHPEKPINYPVALLFATLFYFLFLGMNMIHQLRNRVKFQPFDFFLLLLVTSTYFGAGMVLLHGWNGGAYQGLFTLVLGIINLGLSYVVYKNSEADRNLLFLLIGLTLTFITLTIPIQLHGHAITLFWSAEFVLLYWLSDYSGIRLFKLSSAILCGLTFLSLAMDWQIAGNQNPGGLHLIYANMRGLVTNLVVIASFASLAFLIRRSKDDDAAGLNNKYLSRTALTIAVGLLYLTCMFGVNLAFRQLNTYTIPNVYHRLVTELFALVIVWMLQHKWRVSPVFQIAALVICFLFLVVSADGILELRDAILTGKGLWVHFYMHWVDTALLGALFYLVIQGIRKEKEFFESAIKGLSVVLVIMALAFLSMELANIYIIVAYPGDTISNLQVQFSRGGLTVIWALSSFGLMWLGMKHRQKMLRIISLGLFSIVLLKVFISDISDISKGGKILVFILLGVLLLTVSFMYQKLKKFIIDDKKD